MPETLWWKSRLFNEWAKILKNPRLLAYGLLSLVVLLCVLFVFTRYLLWNEVRPGSLILDPVLSRFEPIEASRLTFALIYGALFLVVIDLSSKPLLLFAGMNSYALLVLVRMTAMYLLPLEAPPKLIPLIDPLVEAAAADQTLKKDLFFSGHTSTMVILTLAATRPWLRLLVGLMGIGVVSLILAQHVHYTVDVFVAPFFAYSCFQFVRNRQKEVWARFGADLI